MYLETELEPLPVGFDCTVLWAGQGMAVERGKGQREGGSMKELEERVGRWGGTEGSGVLNGGNQ